MSIIQRRNSHDDRPSPLGDGAGSRFQLDTAALGMERHELRPTAPQRPHLAADHSVETEEEWFEDLSAEFATSADELYAGCPFVGKVFRLVDGQRRFVCSYSPEEPGTIESFARSGRGGRREGGEYRLRTTVSGHEQEITFYVEGPLEDEQPTSPATSGGSKRLSPEQEEAIEERIRLEEKANARRRYRRELEELEREVSSLKDERDRAERRLRAQNDEYDRLKGELRDAQAAASEARAEAAEARGRLIREHADELSKAEKQQFREVERLRREIAELKQENAILELRAQLDGAGDGRDTFDRILDLVSRLDVPESVLTMLAARFASVPPAQLQEAFADEFDAGDLAGPHAPIPHPYAAGGEGDAPWSAEPASPIPPPPPAAPSRPAPAEAEPSAEPAAAPNAQTMLQDVLSRALDALHSRVEMSPDEFASWLEGQKARADRMGFDMSSAAGPLLIGLVTDAAEAAAEPERVAEYLAPALDRLAPNVRRFAKGPSSFIAQALCQFAEVSLSDDHMRYLVRVLDAYKTHRNAEVAA